MKWNDWLDKGEGGEWYEPHLTNRDVLMIIGITLAGGALIISLIVLISLFR
jgi:hypothetical protein